MLIFSKKKKAQKMLPLSMVMTCPRWMRYNRHGSVVYGCLMDLSKAFDMVEWLELFQVLQERNVSPVYLHQPKLQCQIEWSTV